MYIQVCKGVSTTIDPFWDISLDLPAGTPVIPGAPAPGISLQVSQSWIFITRTKLFLNILKKNYSSSQNFGDMERMSSL